MRVINSKDNSFIKQVLSIIENKKEREKTGLFVAEGLRFCRDAVYSNCRIKSVLFTQEFLNKNESDANIFKDYCDDIIIISDAACNKLGCTVNSQGIFCLCEIPKSENNLNKNKYIILENLRDPGNLGTVIRTAEAFNMDGVILVGNCVDIYNPKVLRSTMGTIFRIPIYEFSDISTLSKELGKNNITLFGAVLNEASKKLSQIEFNGKIAVAIGNEANGLSELFKNICDEFIFIEMKGNAESLNAAVAASVIMWEMQK